MLVHRLPPCGLLEQKIDSFEIGLLVQLQLADQAMIVFIDILNEVVLHFHTANFALIGQSIEEDVGIGREYCFAPLSVCFKASKALPTEVVAVKRGNRRVVEFLPAFFGLDNRVVMATFRCTTMYYHSLQGVVSLLLF